MIIWGGVNIYPQEIENAFTLHPKVADIGVIGVPDPEMGERVVAFVELAPGVNVLRHGELTADCPPDRSRPRDRSGGQDAAMSTDDGHVSWPDQAELNRWHQALAAAADRLRDERGITDPWHLTADGGALWAKYGNRRLRVGGEGAELRGPDDLFEEFDNWALHHRMAGPGRLLDRDRRAMAEWRDRLPALQRFWEDVARHVFRDLEATTDLVPARRIVVHEDEEVFPFPGLSGDVTSGMVSVLGIVFDDDDVPRLERRPLSFPQVWLESPLTHRYLPALTDEADAIGYLASELQDDIIEEVHGAWPECPRHPHPLGLTWSDDDRPVWQCGTSPDITFDVGQLGRPGGTPN